MWETEGDDDGGCSDRVGKKAALTLGKTRKKKQPRGRGKSGKLVPQKREEEISSRMCFAGLHAARAQVRSEERSQVWQCRD